MNAKPKFRKLRELRLSEMPPKLAELAKSWRHGILLNSCAEELEEATVGAHLVRWERLAEATLPESGEGHMVVMRSRLGRARLGSWHACSGWIFGGFTVPECLEGFPDAQVMVIPLDPNPEVASGK